ncbi:MAG: gluconate 2-dehydrogenase subunit 3 family protein [Gemmatimonadota bacterium]|nr:gluconate 2-dehydrogenase subunit 3 family protein [Gemmatimonadota bacterium]
MDESNRAGESPETREDTPSEGGGGAETGGVTRRRALQVLAAGAAGAAALTGAGCAPAEEGTDRGGASPEGGTPATPPGGNPLAAGTPTDPDLIDPVVPWDLVLTDAELVTLAALCDVIIPADDGSPSASAVGAHEFIDEWVSAPYDGNRRDLVLIRGGVVWLENESQSRFGAAFPDLTTDQQTAICDDICYLPSATPQYRGGARFFDRVRDLTSTAFWTTEEGMADLGFVGNRAMPSFDGPPREVLERLGLV